MSHLKRDIIVMNNHKTFYISMYVCMYLCKYVCMLNVTYVFISCGLLKSSPLQNSSIMLYTLLFCCNSEHDCNMPVLFLYAYMSGLYRLIKYNNSSGEAKGENRSLF